MLDPATGASEPLTEHWNGSAWAVVPFPRIRGAVSDINSLSGVTALSRANAWTVGTYLSRGRIPDADRTLERHKLADSPEPERGIG